MLFITDVANQQGTTVSAVLIDRTRIHDFPTEPRQAWILVKPRTKVSYRQKADAEIGTGLSEKGKPYAAFDMADWKREDISTLYATAQNRFDLVIEERLPHLPVFLAERSEQTPCRVDVVVQLAFRTLSGLPDVQGHLAFVMWFEDTTPFELPEEIKHQHSRRLAALAEELRITPGLYLPIEIDREGKYTPGVLHIGECVEGDTHKAAMFFSDTPSVGEGTALCRTLEWFEEGVRIQRTAEIGRITRLDRHEVMV